MSQPTLSLGAPRLERTPEGVTASCEVRAEGASLPPTLWYRVAGAAADLVRDECDPFVAVGAVTAMGLGRQLVVEEGAVSAALLDGLGAILAQYAAWSAVEPRPMTPAPIEAPARTTRARRGEASAAFFSCGVDSFYTLLRNVERYPAGDARSIRHLVLLKGFDVDVADVATFASLRASAEAVAADLGRTLVVVETNAAQVLQRAVDWDRYGHGAALAGVGLLLSGLAHTFFVASSGQPLSAFFPNAVHPAVVPWWSTEGTELVSDGAWATRGARVRFIARFAVARAHLRVCFERPGPEPNCGRCEKCLRTMVELHLAGALAACRLFPATVDLGRVAALALPAADHHFWLESLAQAAARPAERALAEAIHQALTRGVFARSRAGRVDEAVSFALQRLGLTGARLHAIDRVIFRGGLHKALAAFRRWRWRP